MLTPDDIKMFQPNDNAADFQHLQNDITSVAFGKDYCSDSEIIRKLIFKLL